MILAEATALADLCRQVLRAPSMIVEDPTLGPTLVFVPPLTGTEQATFDALAKQSRSHVPGISPAEWLALQPDIDGLVTFQGLATPTLAQTVLAVRAQSRILKAILRS
jgi:hypothetical protein